MASIRLPFPGTEYGPCKEDCEHKDCKATKEMATTKCYICGQEIGYDTGFYRDDHGLSHAICLEKEARKSKEALKAADEERITLTVHIVLEKDYEDLHITDDHGHSCNYGVSDYGNGATARSISDCVEDFLCTYHKMK
jgi:hypothetical protein